MRFENNDILRQMLAKAGEHELAGKDNFELEARAFQSHQLEVFAQHGATHSNDEINARAAFRCLTHASNPAVRSSSLEVRSLSRTSPPPPSPATPRTSNLGPLTQTAVEASGRVGSASIWRTLQIVWAITVLLVLGAIAAHCQVPRTGAGLRSPQNFSENFGMPEPAPGNAAQTDAVIRAALRSSLFADQLGGIIIQVQNQGAVLATRPAGLLVLNCSTNMSCSFSGTTFTMSASSSAGSAWSSLTNPTANLSLSMAANTTGMTWNAATGSSNLFNLTDTANNTGTGYVLNVNLASGSAAKPAQFAVNGNGVGVTNAGLLAKVGTGGMDWASLTNFPSACSANNFVTGVGATLTCGPASGGSTINVNGAALAGGTGNFGNTPSAPAGDLLVTWQKDSSSPTTNISAYLPPFAASGASHAPGLAPDPGSTAGVARFLREDATWINPVECVVTSPVTVTTTGAQNLQICTLGSGDLNTAGKWLRVVAAGVASTAASGQGNVTLSVQIASTTVCSTNAIGLAASKTNLGWNFSCDVLVVTAGSSGSVEAQGNAVFGTLSQASTSSVVPMSNTSTVTVNTTGTPQVAVQVNLSATGNSWTERQQIDRISN